ncbi:DMT family transporter [Propionivibrio sp.]|uniref:DMT family transporter n=1 Tax=Propionivibrio sp. TaxID=2212460 RepID=UPI00272E23FD|nr:DMT family transporter [Propionivibrio sp.]
MSSDNNPGHPDHHPHAGRGILMALLATISYAVVDTLSKYQAREYPVGMIVWARYAVPLVLLLAVFLPRRGTAMLRTAFPAVQLARGILLTGGTIFIVFAYRVMPIAEAQAISFIHPVLLTVLAVIFLKEKVSRLGWTAVLLGFSGVLIIVRPGGGLFTPAAVLPLGLALCFSSYQIFTRLVAGKEDSLNSLFCVLFVGTVAMSAALPLSWIDPTPKGLFFFALIGITSGMGHFSTIKALEFAPASLLAPFAYIQLLWVSILGVLVFGDFPDSVTLVGMAVVVAGGLLVAASRRRKVKGIVA